MTSETLKHMVAQDIVMSILANLADRKGFEVIEEMDRSVFMEMQHDLVMNITIPRLNL